MQVFLVFELRAVLAIVALGAFAFRHFQEIVSGPIVVSSHAVASLTLYVPQIRDPGRSADRLPIRIRQVPGGPAVARRVASDAVAIRSHAFGGQSLEGGRVRQLIEVSGDGGSTWRSTFDGEYRQSEER